MTTSKRILVTGAGGSSGINFINSLRMADEKFYIVGADPNRWHLELPDVDAKYVIPKHTEASYVDALNEIIDKENVTFLHPQFDAEVETVSDHRDEIRAKTFLPDRECVRICHDKAETALRLFSRDVPVPAFAEGDLDCLPDMFLDMQQYNETVWIRAIRGSGSKAALPVKTAMQAHHWIRYWCENKGMKPSDFMLCEFLPGREFAFQSIWKDGKLVTSQARERLEYLFGNQRPSGQSSSPSVAKTVHDDRVNEIATKAIRAVSEKPNGVFCVDLKENSEGIPCVTEINAGRFFTTSNFFTTLGCNMPYYLVKMARGEELPDLPQYNACPADWLWIRLADAGPTLRKA